MMPGQWISISAYFLFNLSRLPAGIIKCLLNVCFYYINKKFRIYQETGPILIIRLFNYCKMINFT